MLRKYEAMFIINAEAAEEEQNKIIARIREAITKDGGELDGAVSVWGKRRLAYEVKGEKMGLYLLAQFRIDPKVLPELERTYRLNENILRALITKS